MSVHKTNILVSHVEEQYLLLEARKTMVITLYHTTNTILKEYSDQGINRQYLYYNNIFRLFNW